MSSTWEISIKFSQHQISLDDYHLKCLISTAYDLINPSSFMSDSLSTNSHGAVVQCTVTGALSSKGNSEVFLLESAGVRQLQNREFRYNLAADYKFIKGSWTAEVSVAQFRCFIISKVNCPSHFHTSVKKFMVKSHWIVTNLRFIEDLCFYNFINRFMITDSEKHHFLQITFIRLLMYRTYNSIERV